MRERSLTAPAAQPSTFCRHNVGIMCSVPSIRECMKCGWNPHVERIRKAKLRGEEVSDDK